MSIKSYVSTLPGIIKRYRKLYVEAFQRPYSWEEEQIERLFIDHFIPLVDGTDNDYRGDPFVGTVVLFPKPKQIGHAEIIDGQQRTATLTMIAAHAIRMMGPLGKPYAKNFRSIISAANKDLWLSMREEDRDAYSVIMQVNLSYEKVSDRLDIIRRKAGAVNRPIYEAIHWIAAQVDDYIESAQKKSGTKKAGIKQTEALRILLDFIRDGLRVVAVEVDSPGQGLAVFEALNTAGLPLTLEQLLKNCLMRVFNTDSQHLKINSAWNEFEKSIKDPFQRTRFLMHYHVAHHGPITKKSAYACYRALAEGIKTAKTAESPKKVKNYEDLEDLLSHFEKSWSFYKSIKGPVKTLGGDVCLPGLMLVHDILQDHEMNEGIGRASYALESALIRFQICKRSLGSLRSTVSEVCRKIRSMKDSDVNPKEIEKLMRKELSSIIPHDKEFADAVEAWHKIKIRNRRAVLFLMRINHYLRAGKKDAMIDMHDHKVGELVDTRACPDHNQFTFDKLKSLGFSTSPEYLILSTSIGNLILRPRGGKESAVKVNNGLTQRKYSASLIRRRGRWLGSQAIKVWYFD